MEAKGYMIREGKGKRKPSRPRLEAASGAHLASELTLEGLITAKW